jgi:hypothetical protein
VSTAFFSYAREPNSIFYIIATEKPAIRGFSSVGYAVAHHNIATRNSIDAIGRAQYHRVIGDHLGSPGALHPSDWPH